MINKRAVLVLAKLAQALALVPVSAIAGEGPGAIVVQEPGLIAAMHAAGAQVYECVENAGKLTCKFRELSAMPPVDAAIFGSAPKSAGDRGSSDKVSGLMPGARA